MTGSRYQPDPRLAVASSPVVRSWTVVDFALIWLGGLLGTTLFAALAVNTGDQDLLLLLGLAGQYIGNLGVLWVVARRKQNPDLGFNVETRDLGYIFLGLILQVAMATILIPLSNLLFPDGRPPQDVAEVIAGADSLPLQLGLLLAAVVLAPITEELMFRGVLLQSLEPRGKRFAMVVSSFVFAAVHAVGLDDEMFWQSALVVLPPIFILGLLLAWLTQRSGRLGPAIFLHSGWNLLAAFVLLLPEDILEQVG